ncbi:MAG TPA: hypothetical protein PLB25_10410 [Rhodoferax sp.]|nr:hypothetical protein [Rhodoferax sp.]
MDRVIQQGTAQMLTPIFDPTFSQLSFGIRPGRNAHQAIRQVQALGRCHGIPFALWPAELGSEPHSGTHGCHV